MRMPGAAIDKCANMVARAEALRAAAGQHQDADRRVAVDAGEGFPQHCQIVWLDAVVLARPVEPDRGAAFRDRDDRRRRAVGIAFGCGHLLSVLAFVLSADPIIRTMPTAARDRP